MTSRCWCQVPEAPPPTSAQAPAAPAGGRRGRSCSSDGEASTGEQGSAAEPPEAESAVQPMAEDSGEDGGADGILELQPHYQYISGLRCAINNPRGSGVTMMC